MASPYVTPQTGCLLDIEVFVCVVNGLVGGKKRKQGQQTSDMLMSCC